MISSEYINRAIDYILNHITEDLSVDDIAHHCNFSRYYLSRLFKMETGESIYEFIKRMKMERSAFRLKVDKDKSITDIGLDYGYSSSNYSTSFRQHHSLSPIAFRREVLQRSLTNPIFCNTAMELESFEACQQKISVEELPDFSVIFERHKGSYRDLSARWGAFMERYSHYMDDRTLCIERTYDDPTITDTDECLYDLYLTVAPDCPLGNTCVLPGGRFAIYHFSGEVKHIFAAYQSIFNVWMPQCRYQIDERYGFEIYRRIDCEAMAMDIDICIPVK